VLFVLRRNDDAVASLFSAIAVNNLNWFGKEIAKYQAKIELKNSHQEL
jgi:hypothetical protein